MAEQHLPVAPDSDERVREIRLMIKIMSRPELGALAGTILIFVFFGVVASQPLSRNKSSTVNVCSI